MAGRRDRGQSDQEGGHRVTSHALHQRGLTGTVFADQSDDLNATIVELRAKGVEFRGEPIDKGWGVVIVMVLPGGVEVVLYEPGDY